MILDQKGELLKMILILYGRSGTVKNIKFKEDVCTMYNGLNRIQKACYFKNTDTFIRQDNMGEKIKIMYVVRRV